MDGNSATLYGNRSCTHTNLGVDKPWWRVDLAKEQPVSEVYIVNRDLRGERLSNFEIRVGRLLFVVASLCIQMYIHVGHTVQFLLPHLFAKKELLTVVTLSAGFYLNRVQIVRLCFDHLTIYQLEAPECKFKCFREFLFQSQTYYSKLRVDSLISYFNVSYM